MTTALKLKATLDANDLTLRNDDSGNLEIVKDATTILTIGGSNGLSYSVGTFTGTLTGVTTTVTGTIQYAKVGRIVTLSFPGDGASMTFTGTSNATSKTITGMPANLYPVAQFTGHCFGYDNGGAWTSAYFKCSTAGVITVYPNMGSGNWTASGSFGTSLSSVSYVAA